MTDFETALENIEEYVKRIDNEVDDRLITDETPARHVGYKCKHGEYTYFVEGRPDKAYFKMKFPFSLPHNLAPLIQEDEAEQIIEENSLSVADEEEPRLVATIELLKQTPQSTQNQFRYQLQECLSNADTTLGLRHIEGDVFVGFDVTRMIFPMEPNFSVSNFYEAATSVITTGHTGSLFVGEALNFRSALNNHLSDSGPSKKPPYYQ